MLSAGRRGLEKEEAKDGGKEREAEIVKERKEYNGGGAEYMRKRGYLS